MLGPEYNTRFTVLFSRSGNRITPYLAQQECYRVIKQLHIEDLTPDAEPKFVLWYRAICPTSPPPRYGFRSDNLASTIHEDLTVAMQPGTSVSSPQPSNTHRVSAQDTPQQRSLPCRRTIHLCNACSSISPMRFA